MSDPAPKRRTAAATASSSAVIAIMGLILLTRHADGGRGDWLQFVGGAVIGVALIFAVAAFLKWRAESKSPGA